MAYATTEEGYNDLHICFCDSVPSSVVLYFNAQWHPIHNQWVRGRGNLINPFSCHFVSHFQVWGADSELYHIAARHVGVGGGCYTYMHSLLELNHPPPSLGRSSITWPPCPSPIQLPRLAHYLRSHPDQQFVQFVLQGLRNGFHVGHHSLCFNLRTVSRNHPSSLVNCAVIRSYIEEELSAGRMVGLLLSLGPATQGKKLVKKRTAWRSTDFQGYIDSLDRKIERRLSERAKRMRLPQEMGGQHETCSQGLPSMG